jgi:hypothetical protein
LDVGEKVNLEHPQSLVGRQGAVEAVERTEVVPAYDEIHDAREELAGERRSVRTPRKVRKAFNPEGFKVRGIADRQDGG